MRRTMLFAVASGLALSLAGAAIVVAHGGEEGEETLAVEPTSVTSGGSVVLAGSGLEPDNDRVIVLAGGHLVVEFGTVRTDAEGMLEEELTIPSHLPTGTYELRAIGDETLTVPLAVTAAVGAAEPPVNDLSDAIAPRDRSAVELAVFLGLSVTLAVVGALLVWRAERFPGVPGG